MKELELVLDSKATVGEGPCWDNEKKVLYWVDVTQNTLNIFDPIKNTNRTINVGQHVGAAVPRSSGGLVLALHHGFYELDQETEELNPIEDPENHLQENRFNDGKCDAAGRFWAGTMELDGAKNAGSLYRLDPSMHIKTILKGVSISNGLGWAPDNKIMYYIDTPTQQVFAFDFDLETGEIKNKRSIISIPKDQGSPDGMTVDADGKLWIAHWNGYQVSRWNPDTGKKLLSIQVPVARVTSCAFGGENLHELYITTASIGMQKHEFVKQPNAGGIFRISVDVPGLPGNQFKG